jgi:hypothetical protein
MVIPKKPIVMFSKDFLISTYATGILDGASDVENLFIITK